MAKLFFASSITLGILSAFVAGAVILVLLYADALSLSFAIILTVVINTILLLVSPFLSDFVNRWFYRLRFLSKEEIQQQYPEIVQLIQGICDQYKFRFPKVGIIPDKNPTAFTYGSGRFNARLVLTEGIFHFLNKEETKAVVAHEMGHVVHRDFIIMMIATTLIQILYQIYAVFRRMKSNDSKKGNSGALIIALVAYALYIIGIYLLLYLSRTREYLADAFSAKYIESKELANALIKIAYGIVTAEDSGTTPGLLGSTRHLGIIDVKNAKYVGAVSYITHSDPNVLSEVMVFDRVSPWATLIELNSTHPLTGKRLGHLEALAKEKGNAFPYDVEAAIQRMQIDKARLYKQFFRDLFVFALPYVLSAIVIATAILANSNLFLLIPAAFGLGLLLQIRYKFSSSAPVTTTILDEMRNPYASPMRGKPVMFSGQVIGRGVPGFVLGEDMMYQDSTGLIFVDYTHAFGFLGNIFFALYKVKSLFGIPSNAIGWFYRSMGSHMALKCLQTKESIIKSHPMLWALVVPILLIVLSIWLYSSFGLPRFCGFVPGCL